MRIKFKKKNHESLVDVRESNILIDRIFAKTNTGITLIALVVTVIVLIILAGISINLVMGENRNN